MTIIVNFTTHFEIHYLPIIVTWVILPLLTARVQLNGEH